MAAAGDGEGRGGGQHEAGEQVPSTWRGANDDPTTTRDHLARNLGAWFLFSFLFSLFSPWALDSTSFPLEARSYG